STTDVDNENKLGRKPHHGGAVAAPAADGGRTFRRVGPRTGLGRGDAQNPAQPASQEGRRVDAEGWPALPLSAADRPGGLCGGREPGPAGPAVRWPAGAPGQPFLRTSEGVTRRPRRPEAPDQGA